MRRGFTLIQISILLTIASLVLVATLPSSRSQLDAKNVSISKMNFVLNALRAFELTNAALPCPADASQLTTSTTYGTPAANGGTTTNCGGGTPKSNYIDSTNHVAIGMVPVRALGLSNDYAVDAFGRAITYAVDTNATVCFQGSLAGTIVVTDNGATNNSIAALVSHGTDGHGAWIPAQSGTAAVRLNSGSTDTDENIVNAHGTLSGSTPSLPANYSSINSLVTSAESTTTTFVKKPSYKGATVFDDLVVYKSNLWILNNEPAGVTNVFPYVTSSPANGSYYTGGTLTFKLTFPYATTVTGTPRLDISLPSGTVYATYNAASSTSTVLAFNYTVAAGDYAPTGMTSMTGYVDLNGGSITENGTPACLTFTAPSVTGIIINPLMLAVSYFHATSANSYLNAYVPTSATAFAKSSLVATSISITTTSNSDATIGQGSPDGGLVATFSPDNKYLVFGDASASGPYLQMYALNSSTGGYNLMSSPFDTTYCNDVSDARWSYGGNYLAVTGTQCSSPKSGIYVYANSGGSFTRVTSIADTANDGMTVAWSHDSASSFLAYAPSPSSTTISVWQNSSGTFTKLSGSKVSSLASISGSIWDMRFSPDDTNFAVATNSSSELLMYSFNSSTGTFTKLATQPPQPSSAANAVSWSPDGTMLAIGVDSSPYVYIYKRSGTGSAATFTQLTTLTDSGYSVNSIAWSATGSYLAVGNAISSGNNLYIYSVSGTTFTALTTPSSAQQPKGMVWRLDFMHSGVNDN